MFANYALYQDACSQCVILFNVGLISEEDCDIQTAMLQGLSPAIPQRPRTFGEFLAALRALCHEARTVRNARIEILCNLANESAVRTLLADHSYAVQYRTFDGQWVSIRAI